MSKGGGGIDLEVRDWWGVRGLETGELLILQVLLEDVGETKCVCLEALQTIVRKVHNRRVIVALLIGLNGALGLFVDSLGAGRCEWINMNSKRHFLLLLLRFLKSIDIIYLLFLRISRHLVQGGLDLHLHSIQNINDYKITGRRPLCCLSEKVKMKMRCTVEWI